MRLTFLMLLYALVGRADVAAPPQAAHSSADSLIAFAGVVYWSQFDDDDNRSTVFAKPRGSSARPFASIAGQVQRLTADARGLYALVKRDNADVGGWIFPHDVISLSGGRERILAARQPVALDQGGVEGDFFGRLASDGERVFLADLGQQRWHSWEEGRVFVFDPRLGWMRPLARDLRGPQNLIAGGGRVYWSTVEKQIQSIALPHGEVETLVHTVNDSVELALDGSVLYWLDGGSLRQLDMAKASPVDTMAATPR